MTIPALRQLSLHLLAIGIALLAAARWTHLVPTASGIDVPTDYINLIRVAIVIAALMLTSAVYLAKSAHRASLETLLLAIIAPIAGILGYALLHSLYVALIPTRSVYRCGHSSYAAHCRSCVLETTQRLSYRCVHSPNFGSPLCPFPCPFIW